MDLIELLQCLDQQTADETINILAEEKIPFRTSSGQPAFDVSSLGSSSQNGNRKIIISVAPADYPKARASLEADALLIALPEDHHLRTATPDELRDILKEADDWSPFDVAHSKRLLEEMGVEMKAPEDLAAERFLSLKKGKEAPISILLLSVILPVLGVISTITLLSVIGCGIALSIALMKTKTLEGRFHTYNKRSRSRGAFASIFAIVVTIIGFYVWREFLRYGDYDLYLPWA